MVVNMKHPQGITSNIASSTFVMIAMMFIVSYLFSGAMHKISAARFHTVVAMLEKSALPGGDELCIKNNPDNAFNCRAASKYLQASMSSPDVADTIERFRTYESAWIYYLAPPGVHQRYKADAKSLSVIFSNYFDLIIYDGSDARIKAKTTRWLSIPFTEIKFQFAAEQLPWVLLIVSFVSLSALSVSAFWLLLFVTMPLSKKTIVERLRAADTMRSLALITSLVVALLFAAAVYQVSDQLMLSFSFFGR